MLKVAFRVQQWSLVELTTALHRHGQKWRWKVTTILNNLSPNFTHRLTKFRRFAIVGTEARLVEERGYNFWRDIDITDGSISVWQYVLVHVYVFRVKLTDWRSGPSRKAGCWHETSPEQLTGHIWTVVVTAVDFLIACGRWKLMPLGEATVSRTNDEAKRQPNDKENSS